MRPRLGRLLLLASLWCCAIPLRAQVILETPKATIELIGLRRWTLAMITDSLARYAPGSPLTGHACAAILRSTLHFADASVNVYVNDPSRTKQYVAITLVEPQDSSRIHYKPALRDSLPGRAEWKAAYAAFQKNSDLGQRAFQSSGFFDRVLSAGDSAKYAALAPLHKLLENPAQADFSEALSTLDHDASVANRVIATVVLASFAYNDSAWYAVVDALRDPAAIVGGTASQVLGTMAQRAARPVDWRPMMPSLRYLVDGTNLGATNAMMQALTRTNVSYQLAAPLLADGGAIVLAKLRSGDEYSRRVAAGFLAQLSGQPASTSAEAFDAWVKGLH